MLFCWYWLDNSSFTFGLLLVVWLLLCSGVVTGDYCFLNMLFLSLVNVNYCECCGWCYDVLHMLCFVFVYLSIYFLFMDDLLCCVVLLVVWCLFYMFVCLVRLDVLVLCGLILELLVNSVAWLCDAFDRCVFAMFVYLFRLSALILHVFFCCGWFYLLTSFLGCLVLFALIFSFVFCCYCGLLYYFD